MSFLLVFMFLASNTEKDKNFNKLKRAYYMLRY